MTTMDDSNFFVSEEAASRVRKEPIQPYFDIQNWPETEDFINEYSKIQDTQHITGYDDHIRHDEKLLLMEFTLLKDSQSPRYAKVAKLPQDIGWDQSSNSTCRTRSSLGVRNIAHRLHIVKTVKDGTLICGNVSYPYLNLESMVDARGIWICRFPSNNRSLPSGEIRNCSLSVLYDYHNPNKYSRCVKYTVRLHDDELLNDIRTKKYQKHVPSLLQLCVSAISTRDLEQYNHMNRTMILALKT